jgi:PAS domain S-box-containing protein
MGSNLGTAPHSQAAEGAVTPSHAAEERFRLLIDSVKDYAIFILDPSGHVRTWNPGAERIKGYTASEILGQHFSIFYPADIAATSKCADELVIATATGRFEEEGWRIRKGGSRFWANVTITALRDANGVLVGFAKVTQDLTLRREAEAETRRFRLLVESVKDYAIFMLTPTGHVATWNPGAERIKGYAASEIIGKHFSTFYPLEAVAAGKCDDELTEATREGRFEEEGWRLRKDGSRFWANVTITALRDTDGTLVGFAKVTRDLTARREAEESRRQLAAERAVLAEKLRVQEFQERFLAVLGHDLRNPLASIDMGAGILRELSTDPAALRILDRMQSSSNRMTRMIEQILDLTRSRLGGGIELYPEAMDLRVTLTRIVDEMRVASPARALELVSPHLVGTWDRDRLEQVFSNLIGNAIVYGNPTATVSVRASVEDGVAEVSVHNDGPPISEEMQGALFNPFRRGERESRSARTSGLGLGLYISQEIVRGHGGAIAVQSSTAAGTTFRVTLPVGPVVPAEPRP